MAVLERVMEEVEIIEGALGRLVLSESLTFTDAFEINTALRTKLRPGLPILSGLTDLYNPNNGRDDYLHACPTPSYTTPTIKGKGTTTDFEAKVEDAEDYKSKMESRVQDRIESLVTAVDAPVSHTETTKKELSNTQLVNDRPVGTFPVLVELAEMHAVKKDPVRPNTDEQDPYNRLGLFFKCHVSSNDVEPDPYDSLDRFCNRFETSTVEADAEDNITDSNVSATSGPDECTLLEPINFEMEQEAGIKIDFDKIFDTGLCDVI